ncbi:MAG: hypothetical protein FJZ01_20850 [Candidatus Sericytochromatia bacterium]|nr:hypothetical protein [Candidatus Tanganyikabacteria bacterium]
MKTFLSILAAAAVSPSLPPLELGTFDVYPGLGGIVVAAPHEGFDLGTASVASAAATVMGAGYVGATGFRKRAHPINVNRPTEGVGLKPAEETRTERAETIYHAYLARLGHAARGSVRLLIEIHGNARAENVGVVEIATVGVSRDRALALRKRLSERFPQVDWRIEPLDELHYRAPASKEYGALSKVARSLHFELPQSLRGQDQGAEVGKRLGEVVTEWLAEASASVGRHLWSGRV